MRKKIKRQAEKLSFVLFNKLIRDIKQESSLTIYN